MSPSIWDLLSFGVIVPKAENTEGPAFLRSPQRRYLLPEGTTGFELFCGLWAREPPRSPWSPAGHPSPASPPTATHSEAVFSQMPRAECLSVPDTNII